MPRRHRNSALVVLESGEVFEHGQPSRAPFASCPFPDGVLVMVASSSRRVAAANQRVGISGLTVARLR